MKVIVCGSQDWKGYQTIRKRLELLPPNAIAMKVG